MFSSAGTILDGIFRDHSMGRLPGDERSPGWGRDHRDIIPRGFLDAALADDNRSGDAELEEVFSSDAFDTIRE